MIRWCAYCQRYQGEVEPFDNYTVTHGICTECTERKVYLHAVPSNLASIRQFFARVAGSAMSPETTASELLREGAALGLQPVDLLLGIVQPVLHQLGERWERAESTVIEEHRVTALCSSMIQLLMENDVDAAALRRRAGAPTVLLVAAEGNYHTLGLQLLDVLLWKCHVSVFTVYPSVPVDEVVALVGSLKPRIVAVSAAMPDQLMAAVRLEQRMRALPPELRPIVVVGGLALRGQHALPASDSLILCRDLRSLIELARAESRAQTRTSRARAASSAAR